MMISHLAVLIVIVIAPWVLISEYEANRRACDEHI